MARKKYHSKKKPITLNDRSIQKKLGKKLKNNKNCSKTNLASLKLIDKNNIYREKITSIEGSNRSKFLALPNEMVSTVLSYMTEYDIFWNVGFTCQRLRALALKLVKIIDLCESKLKVARKHFNELFEHKDLINSIRHIWICSGLDKNVREALKLVLQDSKDNYNILVIDYRLFNNETSMQIGKKFTHLESLLLPKNHRSLFRNHRKHEGTLTNRSIRNVISSCRKLEWIDLRDCNEFDFISNRNVVSLIGDNCKNLECLLLSRCSFTNEAMAMVFRNCVRLEMLILNGCSQLNNNTLIVLADCCPQLKLLCVDDCDRISDDSITYMSLKCQMIQELSLRNTWITDISIKAITKNCPEIKVLNLQGTRITIESLNFIGLYCKQLENLDISKFQFNAIFNTPIQCLKNITCNNPEIRIHLGLRNVSNIITGYWGIDLPENEFSINFSRASYTYNTPHFYHIVKKTAPILAKELGIDLSQLCLEGFVDDGSGIFRSCTLHN